jgi:hypothetical protein
VPDQHHDDSASRPPDDNDHTHSDAHDATVLPFRRKPGIPALPSTQEGQHGRWRVERIDTEPMTAQQYDRAVDTLATLISQWRRTQENGNAGHEEAA